MPLELMCSGAAGAQLSVLDVAVYRQDQDGSLEIHAELLYVCVWRVLFKSDLICLLHATL